MDENTIKNELQKYNVTDAAIAKLNADYMALVVKDASDKAGYESVKTARIDIKKRRVEVEKTRVALKAESLEYGRRVDGEAKRITALLEPIETHLISQEKIVDDEKARIKALEDAKEAERLKVRVEELVNLGCHFDGQNYVYGELKAPIPMVKVWGDEEYGKIFDVIKAASDADKAQKKKEEAEQKAETERIAKVAAEQEAERQRLAAEAKIIQDEKDRQEAERQAKNREAELQTARVEAAEKAAKETEERLKREAEAKEVKANAEAEFRAKMEEKARIAQEKKDSRRPDKQKLTDWLNNFSIPDMELKTEEGKAAWAEMANLMESCVVLMRQKVEGL